MTLEGFRQSVGQENLGEDKPKLSMV